MESGYYKILQVSEYPDTAFLFDEDQFLISTDAVILNFL